MAFRLTFHLLESKFTLKPQILLPSVRTLSSSSSSSSSPSPSPSPSSSTSSKASIKPPAKATPKPNKPTKPRPKTPLDIFFSSFKGFTPKSRKPPSDSWKSLVKHQKWPAKDNEYPPKKEAWDAYQNALLQEVELYFGDETDPKAWRTLCRAVGRYDAPEEIKKCEAILRNTHVNIIDLIHWGSIGGEAVKGNTATVFKSVDELREYSLSEKKIFSQDQLIRYHGGNVVLRHLLRRLFSQ